MAMAIGQIIRKLRKERNLTQEELAEQLNITAQAVSRWENETGLPDISQIVPLANVFGVSVDVLFGTNGINGDEEVEKFISEMEQKRSSKPSGVSEYAHRLACCQAAQEMLKTYPNDCRLLVHSIWSIVFLLWTYRDERSADEIGDRKSEQSMWQNECIRQANVILRHCTDSQYLNDANRCLVSLYRIMGDYAKAEEHAKKLPVFYTNYERGSMLAIVLEDMGRREEAIDQYGRNISKALSYLNHELSLLGYLYRKQKKYEEAYACYRLYPDLYKIVVGDREDESPIDTKPSYGWLAATCMDLGRPDEAMDWLEKWLRQLQRSAQNWNVVTKSGLPYFRGVEMRYDVPFPREGAITSSLEWDSFDPIRETDRFKAIVAEASAFERGE